jgi:hypothetical protein
MNRPHGQSQRASIRLAGDPTKSAIPAINNDGVLNSPNQRKKVTRACAIDDHGSVRAAAVDGFASPADGDAEVADIRDLMIIGNAGMTS